MALTRLSLSDFRNHAEASFRPSEKFVILHGPNGAGKTNILEAVSLLVPGRGLRRAPLNEMVRSGGKGGFAIAAEIEDIKLGTGVNADAPDRRKVRINGANAAINDLTEWLAIIWLTPAMDRLFTDSAGARRRFLDRLVLAVEPSHAKHSSRYERAMRERNKLLDWSPPDPVPDPDWLDGLEIAMAQSAAAINANRNYMLAQLSARLEVAEADVFAVPTIALDSEAPEDAEQLKAELRHARTRDTKAGRTLSGPHRADMIVRQAAKDQDAARCSTGEQKALLLSTILAHAGLVANVREEAPIILLDEVAAHLDPARRMALFERLDATGSQIWMTGTEAGLFNGMDDKARFVKVEQGQLVF